MLQVLKDLPQKTESIEWCEMSSLQRSIYRDAMQRSRKTILELADNEEISGNGLDVKVNGKEQMKKARGTARAKDKKYLENSSNVLMDLRKAASHPMLFRTHFDDGILTSVTKLLLKEPDFKKRGAIFQYVKEDMEVMTDAELQNFCKTYKVRHFSFRLLVSPRLTSIRSQRNVMCSTRIVILILEK